MIHRHTRLALAALAALSSSFACGAAEQIDPVVVTATRSPQKLSEVLVDLTVISREDIERQGFGGLGDLLVNSGAVQMVRNGSPASTTSLFLRGADTRHTVVLVDGVRVDSQATGGASWNGIPLSQIDHVEILRGPASAIYGSDAIGGVVQVFTRRGVAGTTALDLGVGAGNLNTQRADASIAGGSGIVDYAVSIAGERSDGFNATTPANTYAYLPDRDGWRSHSGSLRLGVQPSADHRIEAVALKSHVNGQYDGSTFSPDADDHSIQGTQTVGLSWQAKWLPALQTQLSLGESKEHYETEPSIYVTDTRVRNVSLSGSYQLTSSQQLNFVAERREDQLDNTGLVTAGVGKRHENGAGLGWLLHAGPLNVQAFARRDDDSQFGGVTNGTLMGGYEFAPGLRLVASAGTAFRAPTLYQIGTVYGPDLSKPGVEPLKAERGHNVEIGLKYRGGSRELSITAYRNRVDDLIVFGAAGSCQSQFGCYGNVAQAMLQGVSVAGGIALGPVNLGATLDLQAPKDRSSGHLLARRAKTFGTLRADTTLADWSLGGNVVFSGQRYNDAGNTQALGGYALLNLDAQYRIRPDLRLTLNVDNAADRAYTSATGYASAPRTVFVGLRYTPKL